MTEFLRAAEGKPRQVKVHVTVSGADAEWKGPRGRLSSTIIKTLVSPPWHCLLCLLASQAHCLVLLIACELYPSIMQAGE